MLINTLLEPAGGDLPDMVKRKFIRVLVVYNKMLYFIDGARERGLVYEMVQAFAERLSARLKRTGQEVHVACIPVARDKLLKYLAEGRGDAAVADLTVTPEREALVDFSVPFLKDVREVLVTGPGAPKSTAHEALLGRDILVRRSSSYHESLAGLSKSLASEGKPGLRLIDADEHLEDADLLEMVNAGMIGATVVDDYLADMLQPVFPNITVWRDFPLRTGGNFAVALRKNCPELAAEVNAFVRENSFGSPRYMAAYGKYFDRAKLVRNNLASDDYRRYKEASVYFRKYGAEYGFNDLLIAAQSYQESRIDQSLRAPSGAIGVMQIRPETAADPHVAVKNVELLENNIRAGVKYHRYIIDRYFPETEIGSVDRQLFAFASYNAGPARILKLRREALEMGLDPNRWFDNVENVAAKRIGRETVRYVGNIYKYFVAYQLGQIQEQDRDRAKRLTAE